MDDDDLVEIRNALDTYRATHVALLIAVSALISTNKDQERIHLALTIYLEQQLGAGQITATLSDRAKALVRHQIEELGRLLPFEPPSVAMTPGMHRPPG